MGYSIAPPVQGQPASASLFGNAVKSAIDDLDARVSALAGKAPGVVAIHSRTTTSAQTGNTSTTEVGVIRMDNIPVFAGYSYEITLGRVAVIPTVATATVNMARIRVRQGGAVAGITDDPPVGYYRMQQSSTTISNSGSMTGVFKATADSTISVLVTMQNLTGTGSVFLHSSVGEPSTLYVKLIGPTVNDYGSSADIF